MTYQSSALYVEHHSLIQDAHGNLSLLLCDLLLMKVSTISAHHNTFLLATLRRTTALDPSTTAVDNWYGEIMPFETCLRTGRSYPKRDTSQKSRGRTLNKKK